MSEEEYNSEALGLIFFSVSMITISAFEPILRIRFLGAIPLELGRIIAAGFHQSLQVDLTLLHPVGIHRGRI
jgi:hypothetical protein